MEKCDHSKRIYYGWRFEVIKNHGFYTFSNKATLRKYCDHPILISWRMLEFLWQHTLNLIETLYWQHIRRDYMNRVPYPSVVWSLMHVMVCTWPDLAHVVTGVSSFMSNSRNAHWEVVKWIIRYLKGTDNIFLVNGATTWNNGLVGYTNVNHGGDR